MPLPTLIKKKKLLLWWKQKPEDFADEFSVMNFLFASHRGLVSARYRAQGDQEKKSMPPHAGSPQMPMSRSVEQPQQCGKRYASLARGLSSHLGSSKHSIPASY